MDSSIEFNNFSKYLKLYIIEILINLDYYNFKIFNKYNNNNVNIKNGENNNNIEKQFKLKFYSVSYKYILLYSLVCKEWFSMVSNSINYFTSKIEIKRYSENCLINPYQIKYFIQEVYFKYRREEYGFEKDEEKLLKLYPNLQEIRYLIIMDYSATIQNNNYQNQEYYLNYYNSDEKIFKIKNINNLKRSNKSKITIIIDTPSSLEKLEIDKFNKTPDEIIEIDQLIFISKFGNCSKDLINCLKYYFKPINLLTFSIKDCFSYSKDLIDQLPSNLKSIAIQGYNTLELYSLSNLKKFRELNSINFQFHIHDILYHLGISTYNFIKDKKDHYKFKESDYYNEFNQLNNPCFKSPDNYNGGDDHNHIIFPYGYSISRLCSVKEDWYEMCEQLSLIPKLRNLVIGNACLLEKGLHPLKRYINNEKFYINSKGKESYYSSEEEDYLYDLKDDDSDDDDDDDDENNNYGCNKDNDGNNIDRNHNHSKPIQYINCIEIDDGSGGVIVFGGIPNKNESDISSSSEEEDDNEYIYDDSDIARCEKKLTNRFKKKLKRKQKRLEEYKNFLFNKSKSNLSTNNTNTSNQYKTKYYQLFNEFSLPKSFTDPLKLIIQNNLSLVSLTLRDFDIDINLLMAFKNNKNIFYLQFDNVLSLLQLELFLEQILQTTNINNLTINGIIKLNQDEKNYNLINLNNLLNYYKNKINLIFNK